MEVEHRLIAATGTFDEAHALIVRPNASGHEIISGHNRYLAARQAGLTELPCWVRDLDDDSAYMALVLNNAQGELHPLEEGKHAAESGMDLKAYAERAGKARTSLNHKVHAWRVAAAVVHMHNDDLRDHWRGLATIHPAPRWLWPTLVERLLAEGWTVEQTRQEVKPVKDATEPPSWADRMAIAALLLDGTIKPADPDKFAPGGETLLIVQDLVGITLLVTATAQLARRSFVQRARRMSRQKNGHPVQKRNPLNRAGPKFAVVVHTSKC